MILHVCWHFLGVLVNPWGGSSIYLISQNVSFIFTPRIWILTNTIYCYLFCDLMQIISTLQICPYIFFNVCRHYSRYERKCKPCIYYLTILYYTSVEMNRTSYPIMSFCACKHKCMTLLSTFESVPGNKSYFEHD